MDETTLYDRIAETIRQEILNGALKPGDRLPSVRKIASQWDCTIGTAQRAFQILARQGLVTSRRGQGTRVAEPPPTSGLASLRRLQLVHRAEAFLLEALTTGFSLQEIESALFQAMDRWRASENQPALAAPLVLRFAGSHDPVMAWLAGRFSEISPGSSLELRFTGSLGGLVALAAGAADLAGCHLWDEESDEYNQPFVRRLFPSQKMALVTLAHRSLGLILPKGNPRRIASLQDLFQPDLRFANRQAGSGTRVWLDAALRRANLPADQLSAQSQELLTHTAVAQAVAEGKADAGIGLQAAAVSYALDFVILARERYDLVLPEASYHLPAVQQLVRWLHETTTREWISTFEGYDTLETGQLAWI